MVRLALILFAMIGTTLAGSFVVIGLVMGYDTQQPIVVAALLGFAVGIPASLIIARAISERG